MAPWPPTVQEVKAWAGIDDARDDARLATALAAAVSWVEERVLHVTLGSKLAATEEIRLGTMMLARRLFDHVRSPELLVTTADSGSTKHPANDPDIALLLGARPLIA